MDSCPTYLDPKTLSELRDLRLRTREIVDGLVAGGHRSPLQGHSVEFAQHREYVPGDDVRHIDWKVFARTDRLHLRQYQDETNLCCWIAVDQSESMSFKGPDSSLSKYDYACCVAVTLAWLVLNQQDAVGLLTFSEKLEQSVRPSDQRESLHQFADILSRPALKKQTRFRDSMKAIGAEALKRGFVIILSDAFDDFESIAGGLELLRHIGHQVILLQILDRSEKELDLSLPIHLSGMESGFSANVDPASLRKAYRQVVEQNIRKLKHYCQRQRVLYHQVETDQNIATVISDLLLRKNK